MGDLVSIIMPAYNAGKFIKYSIESVIKQDYNNWELIIVDDCSNDNTRDIIKYYENLDSRIKLIALNKNSGVAYARNVAIKNSRGRYIAFLDSDDLWYPNKLTKQISFMTRNGYSFSFTGYEFIDEKGLKTGKKVHTQSEINYYTLLKGNQIGCLTVVLDKEYYKDLEMPIIKHEDYATWLQLLKEGKPAYGLDEILAKYRKIKNSVSSNKLEVLTWTWRIFRSHQKLNLYKSTFYMVSYIIKSIIKHYF